MLHEEPLWYDDYDRYYLWRTRCIYELKCRVSEAQNHRCAYCYRPMVLESTMREKLSNPKNLATLDHYVPKSAGGPLTYDNAVAACLSCNTRKQSQDAMEFYKNKLVKRQMYIPNWMYELFEQDLAGTKRAEIIAEPRTF